MDAEKDFSNGSISMGGGFVTEEGITIEGDKIMIQQVAAKGVQIQYTPHRAQGSQLPSRTPEMHKKLKELREAINDDERLVFKEKALLADLVEDVRHEVHSSKPSLERLRDVMRELKSVTGEGHQPILKAADAVWNYVVSETL